MVSRRKLTVLGFMVASGVACGAGGAAPEFGGVQDQVVAVGEELVLVLPATDADGDDLTYSYDTTVPEIDTRASISVRPDGAGVFRWRPQASDVGVWFFDFSVSDGSASDVLTLSIEVKSTIGQNGAPVFREPLGTGTTLDLAVRTCVDLSIVVEDQDSSSVTISQEAPIIDGATLTSTGGLTADWSWCPTAAQIAGDDRYTLVLGADDLLNPKTVKHYLVVLRKAPKPDCPGAPPVVAHTPMDESTIANLTVTVDISDDRGLKREPLFYYSTTPPSTPPDLASMTQATMVLLVGDNKSGTWGADVPNPVATDPAGTIKSVYYVIVAEDDDDPKGDCDHLTQAPATASYSMKVTNPGGTGGAGVCESCSTDAQCGGAGDLCVRVGTANEPFCLKACAGPSDCPTNYSCSDADVTSVDGTAARQCVPNSNDCSDPAGTVCADDSFEDNDNLTEASANATLAPGSYTMTHCPAPVGDDEDWYKIDVSSDAQVTLTLTGTSASDLDLALVDSAGTVVKNTFGSTSSEEIIECLTPGTYYARVFAVFDPVENPYTLDYVQTSMSCSPSTCDDDPDEDDDNAAQARPLTFSDIYPGPWVSQTNAICPLDDDWFEVGLVNGDTLIVDLLFTQVDSTEDIDLHFYDASGTNLTPCSPTNSSTCTAAQGQSTSDNEHYEFTLSDATCTVSNKCMFYVVVRGWREATNLYDIQIKLQI